DPAVHLLLGRIALAAGRGADAVEELRRALRLDPLGVAAYRLLGYALVATGRFAEALDQWDQWERLAPRSEAELARLDDVRRARVRRMGHGAADRSRPRGRAEGARLPLFQGGRRAAGRCPSGGGAARRSG